MIEVPYEDIEITRNPKKQKHYQVNKPLVDVLLYNVVSWSRDSRERIHNLHLLASSLSLSISQIPALVNAINKFW